MRTVRLLLAATVIVLLSSCKIILQPSEGGSIVSASGENDCLEGTCVVELSGHYREVYTAVPAPGYFFAGWEELCSNQPEEPCPLDLPPVFTELDFDVNLVARFELKQVPTLTWSVDDTTPTPTRQLGGCVEAVIGCLGGGTSLAQCFTGIVPLCGPQSTEGCCEQACVDQVNTQLGQGADEQQTVLAVFVNDGSCMPGNSPWGAPR